MSQENLISVIIPVYNCEEYLPSCAEMLLGQTYHDIECIFVNDGSTDHSLAILSNIAQNDSRVVVTNKENGGAASARNAGMDIAKGDFIIFCDADDKVDKRYVECLFEAISRSDADMAVCSLTWVYPDGKTKDDVNPNKDYDVIEYISSVLKNETNYITAYGPCCKIIRTDVLKKNKISFPEQFQLSEDRIFNISLLEHIKRVVSISYIGYYYMQNPESLTHNRKGFERVQNIIQAEVRVWNCTEGLLKQQGMLSNHYQLICRSRKHAFLAMDYLISVSETSRAQKHILYDELFHLLSAEQLQTCGESGLKIDSLTWILKIKERWLLELWLCLMRLKQAVKS